MPGSRFTVIESYLWFSIHPKNAFVSEDLPLPAEPIKIKINHCYQVVNIGQERKDY